MIYIRTCEKNGINAIELCKNKFENEQIVFVDCDESKWNTKVFAYEVYSLYRMFSDLKKEDKIVIPSPIHYEEIYGEIHNAGIQDEQIYVIFNREIVNAANFCHMDYLEFPVIESCNLKCNGCGYFSNLCDNMVLYNYDVFERDIVKLSELVPSVNRIRLLAGEPFLNKDLDKYIYKTHEEYPFASLELFTNGILLDKIDSKIWKAIRENDVFVHVSVYPPFMGQVDNMRDILKENGIIYKFLNGKTNFLKFYRSIPLNEMPIENTRGCKCKTLYNGTIATCVAPIMGKKFNDYFNTDYPFESGLIELKDCNDGKDLLNKLNKPFEFCKYCNRPMIKAQDEITNCKQVWSNTTTKGRRHIEDWFV